MKSRDKRIKAALCSLTLLIIFIILTFVCFISLASVVYADEATPPAEEEKPASAVPAVYIDKLIDDFSTKMSGATGSDATQAKTIADSLNSLDATTRKGFLDKLAQKTGISSLSSLADKIDKFDSGGNAILKNKQRISLSKLYNYALNVNSGKLGEQSYSFMGNGYKYNPPKIKDVKFGDDATIYEFEGGGSLSIKGEATFDFENRRIINAEGTKGVEWANMDGKIEVDGAKINMVVNYDAKGESDLKNYPILKADNGEIASPFHKGDVKVDLPKDFKLPQNGKFKVLEKDGKRYTVDSKGGVRELMSSSISLDKEGNIEKASEAAVQFEKGGVGYTKKDTIISRGESAPTDKKQNFIWINGEEGKKAISINSVGEGKMYFDLNSNLDSLELNGEVVIKNGGVYISSDEKGNIRIRKVSGNEEDFKYTIDKLFTEKNKDEPYKVGIYEGDNEKFKGKMAIMTHDGKLLLGGAELKDIQKIQKARRTVGELGSDTLEDVESLMNAGHGYKDSDKITWAHETTHGLNSLLRMTHGGSEGVAAIYLLNGEYVVMQEPRGVTLEDVKQSIPSELRGGTFDLYLNKQQTYFRNEPTYVLDEFSAYTYGSKARAELGIQNRGESVTQMLDFAGYSVGMLNAVDSKNPNYLEQGELKGLVQHQIETAVQVYNQNKNIGNVADATAKFEQLKNSQWFRESAEKYFGAGWVDKNFN